jgi:hypothetical protein
MIQKRMTFIKILNLKVFFIIMKVEKYIVMPAIIALIKVRYSGNISPIKDNNTINAKHNKYKISLERSATFSNVFNSNLLYMK